MVCETSKVNRCTTVGTIGLFWPIMNGFAPILGGLVIHHIGYYAIFIIAILTISGNIALILSTKAFDLSFKVPKKISSLYTSSFTFAIISQGVYDGILWTCTSLVTFFLIQDEISVGAALSFFAIMGAAMSLLLGLISDKNGKRDYFLQLGVIIALPFLVGSAFSSNYAEFTLFVSLMNIGLPLIGTFLTAMAVDKMETNKCDAIVLRERYLNLGRIIGGLLALCCAFAGKLQFTFILASPFMCYIMFSDIQNMKFNLSSFLSFAKLNILKKIGKNG
jgi:MFS family permease